MNKVPCRYLLQFLMLLFFVLTGCQNYSHLPSLPPARLARENGELLKLDILSVEQLLQQSFPEHSRKNIVVCDRYYLVAEYTWIVDMVDWLDVYIRQSTSAEYNGENLAVTSRKLNVLLQQFAEAAIIREGGSEGNLLIGTLAATRKHAWGQLPANGQSDVLLFVYTDRGLYLIDLYTRQIARAEYFPNREHVVFLEY